VVVFGGRGFVGSAVCEEALKMGLEVISLTPSGERSNAAAASRRSSAVGDDAV